MAQIKKDTSLRKAILQAAITGQLISNVEGSTETGIQLLDRIKKERDYLVSKGIIKKQNSGKSELNISSMDFEIPETWVSVELQQIFRFVDYRGMTPNKNGTDIFLVTASNIRSGFMDYSRKEYISKIEYENRKGRGITRKGDLLFTTEAPMGNAAICDLDECSCGQRIITFQNFRTPLINLKLYMYFINSPAFQQQLLDNCTGTTAQGIKSEKLQRLILPLPPLSVQNAIVAKLEQVLPLVDAYENALLQKEELKGTLSDKLKKAILQEAITGRLTESWRKNATITETGKQLLDRIIKERNAKALAEWEEKVKITPKAKKPVPVVASEIEEDEIPFEIPESWCWCRLGDVFKKITDGTHKTPKYLPSGVPFLSVKDMSSGKLDFSHTKFISEEEHNELYKRCNPERGDLLITKVGSTGIPVIVDTDKIFDLFVSVALCKPVGKILDMTFMVEFINSPFVQEQIDRDTIGSANKNWVIDKIVKTVLPLPPLEEQKEIVRKMEELLPLCK